MVLTVDAKGLTSRFRCQGSETRLLWQQDKRWLVTPFQFRPQRGVERKKDKEKEKKMKVKRIRRGLAQPTKQLIHLSH
jgi:hypothetical protein